MVLPVWLFEGEGGGTLSFCGGGLVVELWFTVWFPSCRWGLAVRNFLVFLGVVIWRLGSSLQKASEVEFPGFLTPVALHLKQKIRRTVLARLTAEGEMILTLNLDYWIIRKQSTYSFHFWQGVFSFVLKYPSLHFEHTGREKEYRYVYIILLYVYFYCECWKIVTKELYPHLLVHILVYSRTPKNHHTEE